MRYILYLKWRASANGFANNEGGGGSKLCPGPLVCGRYLPHASVKRKLRIRALADNKLHNEQVVGKLGFLLVRVYCIRRRTNMQRARHHNPLEHRYLLTRLFCSICAIQQVRNSSCKIKQKNANYLKITTDNVKTKNNLKKLTLSPVIIKLIDKGFHTLSV